MSLGLYTTNEPIIMVKSLLLVASSFLLSAACLVAPAQLLAQNSTNETLIIVEIESIDAYSYGDIARDLKGHGQIAIAEACVPAQLVVFKTIDPSLSRESAFLIIKQHINSSSGLQDVTLTEMSLPTFQDHCLAVRRGN